MRWFRRKPKHVCPPCQRPCCQPVQELCRKPAWRHPVDDRIGTCRFEQGHDGDCEFPSAIWIQGLGFRPPRPLENP